ncbi:7753_t:CDS:2 [Diversispora eburnea]|uniref:Mitotic-spindle organizing protein 1 n=1 Tax=Diversispora eburnea TaxID=1213867 RepID=A0A9N9B7K7_9GLOM|nr:7753_t:CDS:2 [Diversispora eburnea]
MEDPKIKEAREAMDILYEISTLLNTGLDRETLSLCLNLCENGVNPEALAASIFIYTCIFPKSDSSENFEEKVLQ